MSKYQKAKIALWKTVALFVEIIITAVILSFLIFIFSVFISFDLNTNIEYAETVISYLFVPKVLRFFVCLFVIVFLIRYFFYKCNDNLEW